MTTQALPLVQYDAVYHIGTLQNSHRGTRGESLEGHLLSVSVCPSAWREIARLGSGPLSELTSTKSLQFLDIHAAADDAVLRRSIEKWAIAHGLAEEKTLWQAWQYDSEGEEWTYSLHATKEAAQAEVYEDDDDEGPNGNGLVEPRDILVGTKELAGRVLIADLSTTESFDYAAMVWAEETQPKLDGVWWNEQYDPDSLSAPRGGIYPDKLSQFSVKKIGWQDAPDEEELHCVLQSRSHSAYGM